MQRIALISVISMLACPTVSAALSAALSAAPPHGPSLSRQTPIGLTAEAAVAEEETRWTLELSELCRRYRSEAMDAAVARRERARGAAVSNSQAARDHAARRVLDIERDIRKESLRELDRRGFTVDSRNGVTAERTAALEMIAALRHPAELADAVEVLSGEGFREDLIAAESDVRTALFRALASEPSFGQPRLVLFGVGRNEAVAAAARDALPARLSPPALNAVRIALAGPREQTINQAAMIAGAHPAGSLIPSLIQAQFEEAEPPQQGDEAWIAIGKSTAYVAGLVPVVGNGSGAFQPIPGVVYEGSVLRIMESAVTIYRTEVHQALAVTIERTTGQPAPPFGFDRDRWLAWYQNEYPQLTQAHQRELMERDASKGIKTSPARADT